MKGQLHPSVRTLGLVSLLNDVGSEMVYPLLPSYVVSVLGASPTALGAIEGAAEASASVFKILFGWVSDRSRARKPFIFAGYLLSALSRPLLAVAGSATGVALLRLLDRGGKGVRAAPRDALVAEVADPAERGLAFGFQRAMDNVGAVIGPLFAALALAYSVPPGRVFLLAALPGVLVILAVLRLREHEGSVEPREARPGGEQEGLPRGFLVYLVVLAVFTLGNSSDAFLLLRARDQGLSPALVPALWAFHGLVKALLSTPLGSLSDRMGRKPSIVVGWGLYALTYAGFAVRGVPLPLLFGLYALHYSFTEGPERAFVSDLTRGARGGRAFGLFHGVTGAMLLPASLLTGWLWTARGAGTALGAGAVLAGLASLGLLFLVPSPGKTPES